MSGSRILVVDDEVSMLYSVERVLAPQHEVATAATPGEALRALREHDPQLAVIDIRMPELDGFALVAQLREQRPDLDVIFMTGAVYELDRQLIRAIRDKAFYFIQKPFDREVLLTLVDRCLEQRRLEDENRAYVARLEAELEAARAFQRSLLPPELWRVGETVIAARYSPCDALGGDLYDYVDLGDGRTALILADVSGHGVSAAMLTGIVKSAFHDARSEQWSPRAVIDRIAASLRPFDDDRFATVFCARLDPAGGRLEYVNAGHPAPYLWSEGGRRAQLGITGPLVSPAFPDLVWELGCLELCAGDRLLAYTDGITEARSESEFFGEGRLGELLAGSWAGPASLLERVFSAVEEFTQGRPADDDRTAAAVFVGDAQHG